MSRWERTKAKLEDTGLVAAVVGLFGFLLWIVVQLALAKSRENPIELILIAMGIVVQGVLAGMVWNLTRQQFEFAKQTEKRQHQIDTYPLRKKLVDEVQRLFEYLNANTSYSLDDIESVADAAREADALFPEFKHALWNVWEALDSTAMYMRRGLEAKSVEKRQEASDLFVEHRNLMLDILIEAIDGLRREMAI